MKNYTVIKDTREKDGWDFSKETYKCDGTLVEKLDTGDYSLRGYESSFVIERKGSVVEYAQNVVQDRFIRELERLASFEHPFLILEFSMYDMLQFPKTAKLPQKTISKIRLTGNFLLKKTSEFMIDYKIPILFCNNRLQALKVAEDLFRRISEKDQRRA